MELSKQCVSLDIAKRLKELGCKQESLFWWIRLFHGQTKKPLDAFNLVSDEYLREAKYGTHRHELAYSAYTVAELGEMLKNYKEGWLSHWSKPYGKWHTVLQGDFENPIYFTDTEADARGKMLIYLLEQGLLKAN